MLLPLFEVIHRIAQELNNFKYGAWGEVVGGNSAADATPFGFTGRWGGYSDGRVGKVLNWNRWYGPVPGRWLNRDPIGVEGGNNQYVYGINIPTLQIDPFGEESFNPSKDWCGSTGTENVPDGIPGDPGLFKKACYAHDECYGLCNSDSTTNNASAYSHRKVCDKNLSKDMKKACAEKYPSEPYSRWRCQNLARIYEKALRPPITGGKAYQASQQNCLKGKCYAR